MARTVTQKQANGPIVDTLVGHGDPGQIQDAIVVEITDDNFEQPDRERDSGPNRPVPSPRRTAASP
jgi:hypothetical protein